MYFCNVKRLLLFVALFLSFAVCAQDSLRLLEPAPVLHRGRVWGVALGEAVLGGGSLIGLNQLWYADYPRQNFHVFNDNAEWLQMDKCGHALTSYALGRIGAQTLRWGGVRANRARWYGGLLGVAYLSGIEVLDGYSSGWGFSWGDQAANGIGAALFIVQDAVWHEQRITPKFGFRRSTYAVYRPNLLGSTWTEQLLKDYNGQTYWLSVNVSSFLAADTRFPRWLNVAVGYGANGMTGGNSNPVFCDAQGTCFTFERYRQYYLSLDIDLTRLPVKRPWLKTICSAIGWIKIPAPGVVIGNGRAGFVVQ